MTLHDLEAFDLYVFSGIVHEVISPYEPILANKNITDHIAVLKRLLC